MAVVLHITDLQPTGGTAINISCKAVFDSPFNSTTLTLTVDTGQNESQMLAALKAAAVPAINNVFGTAITGSDLRLI